MSENTVNNRKRCLVLDAMGVIFQAADDVEELLVPFVRQNGGHSEREVIQSAYHEASLGDIDADGFWDRVGLSPSLEDSYLEGHALVSGVAELLAEASELGVEVWYLSNDVGRWSRKLRERFRLDRYLSGTIISSEVRSRKPSEGIYRYLISQSGRSPEQLVFWDDRQKNVDAAARLNIEARLFEFNPGFKEVVETMRGWKDA